MADALNITDEIFARAARDPSAIAVIDPDGIVDYGTLCGAVCRAARRFREAGWKAGDIVGISLLDSPALHLVSGLALARMGVAHTSIAASDSAVLRSARARRLGITGLVADADAPATPGIVTTVAPERAWLKSPAAADGVEDIRAPGGDGIWFVSETSGTTAHPKLIGVSHHAEDARRRHAAAIFSHLPGERFLSLTGMRFVTALRRSMCCLSDGGTVTLPPAGLATDQLLRWIDQHHVTYLSCVPMHVHQFLRDIHTSSPRLPSLRILRVGSAALSASALQEVRARISPNVYVSYGIGEGGPVIAATPAMLDAYPDTMGRPLPEVEIEIVDERDVPVPDGTPGHLRVRGPGVISSYLGGMEAGQTGTFRDGWSYPGDIALKNTEGLLFHKGRADEVMNFDGIMVGPAEIESVLRQHPAVVEVAAFALYSREHQDIPAAAVVSSQPLNPDELGRFCADRLGIRSPRLFIQVAAIPRTARGKILRRQLAELAIKQLQGTGRS